MDKQEREYFNDRVGRSVHVGDHVVYAVRRSSSMWLKEAVVEKIEVESWTTRNGYNREDWTITVQVPGGTRKSLLETPSRIVLVKTAEEVDQRTAVNLITFGESAYDD